ncbi:MAG: hypothetical protein ACOZAO_01755 [Patescibacteria group bacterium]
MENMRRPDDYEDLPEDDEGADTFMQSVEDRVDAKIAAQEVQKQPVDLETAFSGEDLPTTSAEIRDDVLDEETASSMYDDPEEVE